MLNMLPWGEMASHCDCHHMIIIPCIMFTINNDTKVFTWYNAGNRTESFNITIHHKLATMNENSFCVENKKRRNGECNVLRVCD